MKVWFNYYLLTFIGSGILGRTPSSELLSNLSSFNSSLSQSNELDSSFFSIHKVVVLGMKYSIFTIDYK